MAAVGERRRRIGPGPAGVGRDIAQQRSPSNTLTVALASAVPLKVSVLSLVMPSPTVPLSVVNEAIVGAAGAAMSMVTLSAADATPVLPAASVAVAVRLWLPLASAAVV